MSRMASSDKQQRASVEDVVGRRAGRHGPVGESGRQAEADEQLAPFGHAGWIDETFYLFGDAHRGGAVQLPESHFRMRFDDAQSKLGPRLQEAIDLADLRKNAEGLIETPRGGSEVRRATSLDTR